jgi:bifunctional NMN adenylyltransferase/nudix hydrolase
MKPKENTADVAVIVARFQVHNLSDAHRDLLDTVIARHKKVIVFLGLSPLVGTRNNPLDFESRKQMVLESYPNVTVLYIKDNIDDRAWSKRLDEQIADLLLPNQSVVLYGGRNSFIEHYLGRYDTLELESKTYLSGTELRRDISSKVKSSADFRAGVIWATHNQWARVQSTVDVAIYDFDRNRLLLVRKNGESQFRFPGGYSQPETESFEMDAKREVMEEAGVEVGDLKYIGSYRIDDWRYRNEVDKIKTMFFIGTYVYGSPTVKDTQEIAEARWFTLEELSKDETKVVAGHLPLFVALTNYLRFK